MANDAASATLGVPALINSLWGFLSVLVVVIGVIVIVLLLRRKNWRIKAGPVEIDDRADGSKSAAVAPAAPPSPHFNCPHAHDISEVARKTAELGQQKASLKVTTFNMQVKFYDEQVEKIMEMFRHSIIKLLTSKTDNSIPFIDHPDYKRCENILYRIEAEIRVYFIARFTENHYATYDVDAQLRYVEDKVHIVLTKLTSKLNMYWCCQDVLRADIYEYNKAKIVDYTQLIEAIFTEAFSLARACAEKEKLLDAEYTAFLEGTVGGTV